MIQMSGLSYQDSITDYGLETKNKRKQGRRRRKRPEYFFWNAEKQLWRKQKNFQ